MQDSLEWIYLRINRFLFDLCAALRAELRHIAISRLVAALRASCRSCRRLRLTAVAAELTCIACLTAGACPASCYGSGLRLTAVAAELTCVACLAA